MVTAYGGTLTLAVLGTTMVAVGNLTGRLAGGILSDYLPVRSVVIGAHAISVIGLMALIVVPNAIVAVAAICMGGCVLRPANRHLPVVDGDLLRSKEFWAHDGPAHHGVGYRRPCGPHHRWRSVRHERFLFSRAMVRSNHCCTGHHC